MNLLKATFFILLLTNIFSCKQCNKEIKFSKNHTDFIPNYSEVQLIFFRGVNLDFRRKCEKLRESVRNG